MKHIGRIAMILAVAALVCGLAWAATQWTSAGATGDSLQAGVPQLTEGQMQPAWPEGDFAGRAGGHEGGGSGLVEVGTSFAKVAAIVLAVVAVQRLFTRRQRRPAAL